MITKNTPIISDTVLQLTELRTILFDSEDAINTKIALIKEALRSDRHAIHSIHIARKLLASACKNVSTRSFDEIRTPCS